jgi:hypothetical protein
MLKVWLSVSRKELRHFLKKELIRPFFKERSLLPVAGPLLFPFPYLKRFVGSRQRSPKD